MAIDPSLHCYNYNSALSEFPWRRFSLVSPCHPYGKNLTDARSLAYLQAKWWCPEAIPSEDDCNLGTTLGHSACRKVRGKRLTNISTRKNGIYKCQLASQMSLSRRVTLTSYAIQDECLKRVSTTGCMQLLCWSRWVQCEGALGSQLLDGTGWICQSTSRP